MQQFTITNELNFYFKMLISGLMVWCLFQRPNRSAGPATVHKRKGITVPRRLGLVVSSPPVIKEIGAMGREIESRQDFLVAYLKIVNTHFTYVS
jgi:hypothetical protein